MERNISCSFEDLAQNQGGQRIQEKMLYGVVKSRVSGV